MGRAGDDLHYAVLCCAVLCCADKVLREGVGAVMIVDVVKNR